MTRARKPVAVTVALEPTMVALLDATARHLGKSRDETMSEALRFLFVALPRPDD